MKKVPFWGRLVDWWKMLHLADRLLLLFMIVLMVQSGHNLLFHELPRGDSTEMDVVIRTTMAGIFGYFISAGVQRQNAGGTTQSAGKIGFSLPAETESGTSLRMESAPSPAPKGTAAGRPPLEQRNGVTRLSQQMIIVAVIGLSALGLLIYARNWREVSPQSIAALSQLRDFVSGSVGFLIGHGGTKENLEGR